MADNLLLTKCGLHYTLDLHYSIVTVDGITVYRNGLVYNVWFFLKNFRLKMYLRVTQMKSWTNLNTLSTNWSPHMGI